MQKLIIKNKYQSPNRMNILTAAGIAQINEPIFPQNGERIWGDLGVVYFNQASQYNDPNNPSDPNAPITPPNCPNCGGGVEAPCNSCVTLAEAAGMSNTPCCISDGQDCETGEIMPICLSGNCGGGEYDKDCNPPPQGVCTTALIHFVWTGGSSYKLSTLKDLPSDINSGIDENYSKAVQNNGGGEIQNERTETRTRTVSCGGEVYEITYHNAKRGFVKDGGWANSTASFTTNPSQTYYNKGLQNWKKPSGKIFKNGKFEDICGSEEEPADDFTVCDGNGNKYKISTDSSGKPKVTPIS